MHHERPWKASQDWLGLLKPTREPSSCRRQRRGDWWTLLAGGRGLARSGSRGGADVPEAVAPEEPV